MTTAELVERHHVQYHVYPAEAVVGADRRQVGFDVELLGTRSHEHGATDDLAPDCADCGTVWSDMKEIAEEVFTRPPERLQARIRPRDVAVELIDREAEPVVRLVVELRRTPDALAPVDPQDHEQLGEIERALHEAHIAQR